MYVAHTLAYVGVRCYMQRLNNILDMLIFFSVCERIDNTLLIRPSYARHTLNTLDIRQRYVTKTLLQTVAS